MMDRKTIAKELQNLLFEFCAHRLPHGLIVEKSCHIEILDAAEPDPHPLIEIKIYPYGKPQ